MRCSQGRPEPSSELTASTKMAFVKMGRGEETDDCPRAAFPFLGFSANLSNCGAGDSVSVSCGRGGLTPSGGRIWPKLFGFAALCSRELSPGGGTHLSFTPKHFRSQVAWCGDSSSVGWQPEATGGRTYVRCLNTVPLPGDVAWGCCGGLVPATLDPGKHPFHLREREARPAQWLSTGH